MYIKVYKNGLRKYSGEDTDEELIDLYVIQKLTYEQTDVLPIGTKVYVTDTCVFPFYKGTSGITVKIPSEKAEEHKWGLKNIDSSLFWSDESVLGCRIEVYSIE